MKVYIVTAGNYSDYRILAVFSSRYRAKKFIKDAGRGRVETWLLDEPYETFHHVGTCMMEDGSIVKQYHIADVVGDGMRERLGFEAYRYHWDRLYLVWIVDTDSEERAAKVTNEKRAQILAAGIWGDYKRTRELFIDGD